MKILRSVFATLASLMLAISLSCSPKAIGEPKGFDNKVYHASLAMYASSEMAGINNPKFICTVTAYKKVDKGYLVIGAGHCTSANDAQLPPDMKYYAAEDIGQPVMPMQLIKAEMDDDNGAYDYAIYYLPTDKKLQTIALGDERELSIGDKTVDVNFSLGVTKMVSPGVISSAEEKSKLPEGYFFVQEFDSHGASGSAVVSENTHKIIGLVIAGYDGATMPTVVESISHIDERLEKLRVVFNGKEVRMFNQDTVTINVR